MQNKTKFKQTEIGEIPEDWKVKSLGEISQVEGGGTPSTSDPSNFGGSIPWITPKDLSNYDNKCIFQGERSITDHGLKNSSAKLLPQGTVLLSTRAPVGYVAIAGQPVTTNQGFRSLIPTGGTVPEYIYYLLKGNTETLQNNASGSTFQELSGTRLSQLKFAVPPISEQQQIVSILSSLDDKIELNRKMNKTLEEIGRALFKRWFVDFEFPFDFAQGKPNFNGKPYKSSGGKMVDSEIGEIPVGWKIVEINDFGKIVCGKTPPKSNHEYFGGNIPFIKIPDMHGRMFVIKTEDTLTSDGANYQKNKTLPKGSICVSCIATVGLVCITTQDSQTNQQINSIIPNKSHHTEYLYFVLSSRTKQLQDFASGGSATLNLNTGSFSNIPMLSPGYELLAKFHSAVESVFEQIMLNAIEDERLSAIRDSLLPRLMSGKLRVN